MNWMIALMVAGIIWLLMEIREAKRKLQQLQSHILTLSHRIATLEQRGDSDATPTLDSDVESVFDSEFSSELSGDFNSDFNSELDLAHAEQPVISPPTLPSAITEQSEQSSSQSLQTDSTDTVSSTWEELDTNYQASTDTPPRAPSAISQSLHRVKNVAQTWLSTGNIPVKIGMLVLIAAVIAFLRYATNQGWLRLPTEYKLLGVAAAAVGALVFAWLKRDSKRSFSLSVQGGSLGVLLLVIFAAVKMYGLLSPNVGFILSVLTVLLAALLALQQDAKTLAMMAIFAGFLAPIWLSDGSGNHVVLLSYYAVLNVGIFIIAWLRPWRELNLLGFVFTYGIGSTWGGLRYQAADFATTEPFVVLFFLFYLFIPLRYAQRQGQGDSRYQKKVDAALLFGTPLVTLMLQVGMLSQRSDWLALSCLVMGLVYALLAWLVRANPVYETLQKAYVGLAAGLMTLAVPIGLSAKATTALFALEGAGAMWLGAKERRTLTWGFGALLQLGAGVAFFFAYQSTDATGRFVFNDFYLSALLIAVSAWLSTWVSYKASIRFQRGGSDDTIDTQPWLDQWLNASRLATGAQLLFVWGMAWWITATVREILLIEHQHFHLLFGVLTLTAAALVMAYRKYRDNVVIIVLSLLLMTGLLFAVLRTLLGSGLMRLTAYQPLEVVELLACWGLYVVVGVWTWRQLATVTHKMLDGALVTWFLALATFVSTLVYQCLPLSWVVAGSYWWLLFASWLGLAVLLCFTPRWLTWVGRRPNDAWQGVLAAFVMLVISVLFVRLLSVTGGASQWWLPLLNSTDLLMLFIGWIVVSWELQRAQKKDIFVVVVLSYIVALSLVINITWRTVWQWSDGAVWSVMSHPFVWGDGYWLALFGAWVVVALGLWALLQGYVKNLPPRWLPVMQAVFNAVMAVLTVTWFCFLAAPGHIGWQVWLPLFNPLAVLQWAILLLMWLWMCHHDQRFDVSRRSLVVSVLMLLLITVMTLRFVYHYAEITWGVEMFNNAIVQMALTFVWSILGVVSWLVGSRRNSRAVWLLGAVLMSVVLLKLVFIDRGHLGNLFGILSFFAYGLLCVIVGYFAPVPPATQRLHETNSKNVEVS